MSDESSLSGFARLAGIAAAAGAIFLAANTASAGKAERSMDTETPPLTALRDFDAISLNGSDDAIVTRGSDFFVQVDGDPRAIDRLAIDVRDGTLRIGRKRRQDGDWSGRDKGVTVRVTLPVLRRVALAGSGDMRVDRLSGDRVEAALSGSGDLRIAQIEADEARVKLAGSGDISLGGDVRALTLSIAGSGDIHAGQLAAQSVTISIAGSGDAYVQASNDARVTITGSGDAMIKGTTNCTVKKTGSGDVHCKP